MANKMTAMRFMDDAYTEEMERQSRGNHRLTEIRVSTGFYDALRKEYLKRGHIQHNDDLIMYGGARIAARNESAIWSIDEFVWTVRAPARNAQPYEGPVDTVVFDL